MTILPRLRLLVSLLVALSAASAPLCFGQEWEKVLAAAKKEGKVAVIGPVGADRTDNGDFAFLFTRCQNFLPLLAET